MRTLLVTAMLTVASSARARPPLPAEQLDGATRVTLAKAFVGEAGWDARRDWAGIAWVLARRWLRTQVTARGRSNFPTFADLVRHYCAPLRGEAKKPRHLWLRALTADGLEPAHWPRHRVPWADRVGGWRAAMTVAWEWAEGLVVDPCRGRAWHFGGPDDDPPAGYSKVWCGRKAVGTIFYARSR